MRKLPLSKAGQRLALSLGAALATWLLVVLLVMLGGLFATARLSSADFLFTTSPPPPRSDIVVAAIDEKTLSAWKNYGRLDEWPRSLHAQVLTNILAGHPRVVATDILFDAAAPGDQAFAAALASGRGGSGPASATILAVEGVSGGPAPATGPTEGALTFSGVVRPITTLGQAASGLAEVNVVPDEDGSVRRVPLFVDAAGTRYPSLSLLAALSYLRRPDDANAVVQGGILPVAGRRIPLDATGRMIVDYPGLQPGSAALFPEYSYVDIAEGKVPPSAFADKMVFIGATAVGLQDDYWTPASRDSKTAGVLIHASAAATIVHATTLSEESPLAVALLALLLVLAAGTLTARARPVLAALGAAVLAVLLVGFNYLAFDRGIVPDFFTPLLALAIATGVTLIVRVVHERREQSALRRLLGGYLSPALMAKVTQDPEQIVLGGEKRRMTVLFSDVRGFTTASEHLDPTMVVDLLNEYFTAMGDAIFKANGVIDKYIGDAIMAFWNAPLDQPEHEVLAIQAALDMQQRLRRLNQEWKGRGVAPLANGIGVNTGEMAVGNMGSAERFSYTVIGDAVNLSSRLEGLTKQYHCGIIVGAETAQALPAAYALRELDMIVVKGRSEPVQIFEVLATSRDALEDRGVLLEAFEQAMALYQQRDWPAAAAAFARLAHEWPEDGPSQVYAERCAGFVLSPPPADWNGATVAVSK